MDATYGDHVILISWMEDYFKLFIGELKDIILQVNNGTKGPLLC